jgi:hypothetical protein
MNPVQLNKKENEPSSTCHRPNVLAQYHSGTACQIRYYNYCHNKQPPAEEAKAIMAGMCPRAPGPRDLLPIFSEFSPSRSALSCNFTLRFIYATNVIPPRPRQISSLPHVAGPRRSGSRSICCTLLVLGLGWVGERGPSPLCRASDPLTGGPGERFRRAVLSSCPDLHDLLWDVVSARRLVAILVCCTSTSPPTF